MRTAQSPAVAGRADRRHHRAMPMFIKTGHPDKAPTCGSSTAATRPVIA
jgi:hypothetical protein